MDKKLLYYIWLSSSLYAGSVTPKILLEYYKDIEKIYNATPEDYLKLGIRKKDAQKLADKSLEKAEKYYNFCVKERVGILCYDNPYYPQRLKCISDPPPMFYYRGRVEMLDDHPCFAMVGTRSCSENGFRNAYRIGYKAAVRGAVAVNGIAQGIDAAILTGALDAGGYAVALLGSGIDRIYPASNKELFSRLARQGLILSEFSPYSRPDGKNFPVRNRVISGLSLGCLVLEADMGSGAMHTASHAYSQGRRMYAVPGDITSKLYEGPLSLIIGGATPVTDADDFISEYALMFPHRISMNTDATVNPVTEKDAVDMAFSIYEITKDKSSSKKRTLPEPKKFSSQKAKKDSKNYLSEINKKVSEDGENNNAKAVPPSDLPDLTVLSVSERAIYSLFEQSEILTVDEIASKGIKVDDVLSSLTMLEIYGFVTLLPGGRYQKSN